MRIAKGHFLLSAGCLAAAALMGAAPVSADVVIHFTSGKTLPAKAVRYVDDMVEVDLGGDGQITFPRAAIERVEVPERALNLERNTAINRRTGPMIAGSTERAGERPADDVEVLPPPRQNPGLPATREAQVDKNGMAVTNAIPFANSYAATRLKNVVQPDPQAARYNNVSGGGSLRGTHFAGGRYVMASDAVPVRPAPAPVTLRGGSDPTPDGGGDGADTTGSDE